MLDGHHLDMHAAGGELEGGEGLGLADGGGADGA